MSCRNAAMNYLARREHSRQELIRKLSKKDFSQDEIETALDGLEQDGLLDDARFAEAYTRARVNKGFGPVRIRQELNDRGVSSELTEQMLTHWSDDWIMLAQQQQQKRFKCLAEDYTERVRQARFLQHRGFTSEQIWQVLGGDD
ncbi:MAG TPA: regulatory protein RecX [Chromatiales bacterium]|nr:regulatory protein RecX [Thiotrichales bacterium]HIP67310.1 regulatory protein RecX [Chromatiales bacterium]